MRSHQNHLIQITNQSGPCTDLAGDERSTINPAPCNDCGSSYSHFLGGSVAQEINALLGVSSLALPDGFYPSGLLLRGSII